MQYLRPLPSKIAYVIDINTTVKIELILKQQMSGLLCRFALVYLDEGCSLMLISNTPHHYSGLCAPIF